MSVLGVIKNSRQEAMNGRSITERREETDTIPAFHKRMVVKTIDEAIFALTRIEKAHDFHMMRNGGVEYIGAGSESIVLRVGEMAIKYAKWSEAMVEEERLAKAAEKQRDFEIVQEYLGQFVLQQSILVDAHPYYSDHRAIQTHQPFINFRPAVTRQPVRQGDNVMIDTSAPLDQLSDFLDASRVMYHQTGMVVDTNGPDNIVVHDSSLILLDTQPIGRDNPGVQEVVMTQLDSLGRQLDTLDEFTPDPF